MIVYTVGIKWRGFNKKENYAASHVVSLGERRANKLMKESLHDLILHTRTHLLRAYPAGMRFTSSNYSPLPYWAAGVQLVALNWQTFDLGAELNAAFFQRNGRSGYILKPPILRQKRAEGKDREVLGTVERYMLICEVLSAQQLPRPREDTIKSDSGFQIASQPSGGSDRAGTPPSPSFSPSKVLVQPTSATLNPFVEVSIHSPPLSATPSPSLNGGVHRTAVVHGNGFNPVFERSRFEIGFRVPVDMLDLAFLRLECMVRIGNDDVSLGKYSISLPVLQPGRSFHALQRGDDG